MCGVDAVLVGCVRVDLKRLIIVAEVARIDAAEQALALHDEALAVGRGSAAIAPEAAELQAVMVMTAWMVRTGIAVSRLLINSGASLPEAGRRSRCCLSARRAVAFSGASRALRPLPCRMRTLPDRSFMVMSVIRKAATSPTRRPAWSMSCTIA